ncbi:MAG: hypothetical protein ACLFUU_01745 [Desulfobacteraceae bacterium]
MHERCVKCEHWDWDKQCCRRIVKAKVLIGMNGGEIDIQTQPGLLPQDLEQELALFLGDAIPRIIDSWTGWREIHAYLKKNPEKKDCAARQEAKGFRQEVIKIVPLYP